MCYGRWHRELDFLRRHPKCANYGDNETPDTIWDKLPQASKDYWLMRAA